MASDLPTPTSTNRFIGFFRDVISEMNKVTWPERTQVRQLSVYVVGFALLVGLLILVMDLVLQGLLMKLIPSLLGRG